MKATAQKAIQEIINECAQALIHNDFEKRITNIVNIAVELKRTLS